MLPTVPYTGCKIAVLQVNSADEDSCRLGYAHMLAIATQLISCILVAVYACAYLSVNRMYE